MADIARIGFAADTSDLKTAKTDLNALVPAAKSAETASMSLTSKLGALGSTLSSKVSSGLATARTALVGFAAGMLGALAGGAILMSLSGIADRIDDISKAASKLKVNMGDLQGLAHAADLAGVDFNELATVANKMNRVIGDAIAKGKGAEGVFKLLGISAQELSKLPIDERFGAIADKMNAMNLTADQTALILGKLGDRSGSLAALFEGGSEAINEASAMLDRFNGKLTNEQGLAVEAMNDSFTNLQASISAVGTQLVATFGPYLTPIINGIAEAIGAVSRGIRFLATDTGFVATSFRTLASIIMGVFNPIAGAIKAVGTLFQQVFGVTITQAIKNAANFMINAWNGAFQATAIIWEAFPSVIGAAAVGAVNMALREINRLIQGSLAALNSLASAVSKFAGGEGGNLIDPEALKIPTMSNPYADEARVAFAEASKVFQAEMGKNNFATNEASATAKNTGVPAFTDLGGALDKAGGSAKKAGEEITALGAINKELTELGKPFDEASSAFTKLQELQKNGIIAGDQYTTMLGRIKEAFIATGGTADQWGKIIASKTNVMADALKSFAQTSLDSVGSALADLAVDGKADFKALADGIIKDLIRMAFQLAIVRPLMSAIFPTFATGGAFNSGGAMGFAKGGEFTNKTFNKPTPFKFGGSLGVMGEAGPEAVMPLKRGPDGSLGVESHGGGGRSNVVQFNGGINLTYEGTGDSERDKQNAEMMGEVLNERIKQIANEQISSVMSYGGASNPRGGAMR